MTGNPHIAVVDDEVDITDLLAEGAERGFSQQALRAANARIAEILEQTKRHCREQRRRRSGRGA